MRRTTLVMRTILDMMSTSFWPAKSWEFGSSVKLKSGSMKRGETYDAAFGYALEEVAHDLAALHALQ